MKKQHVKLIPDGIAPELCEAALNQAVAKLNAEGYRVVSISFFKGSAVILYEKDI